MLGLNNQNSIPIFVLNFNTWGSHPCNLIFCRPLCDYPLMWVPPNISSIFYGCGPRPDIFRAFPSNFKPNADKWLTCSSCEFHVNMPSRLWSATQQWHAPLCNFVCMHQAQNTVLGRCKITTMPILILWSAGCNHKFEAKCQQYGKKHCIQQTKPNALATPLSAPSYLELFQRKPH